MYKISDITIITQDKQAQVLWSYILSLASYIWFETMVKRLITKIVSVEMVMDDIADYM